jgi:hypothetical protein
LKKPAHSASLRRLFALSRRDEGILKEIGIFANWSSDSNSRRFRDL